MSDPTPEQAAQARRTRTLLIFGAVVPCILFLVAMIAWTVVNGMPGDARATLGGVMVFLGIGMIVGCYWLADRYWIRPKR